MDNIACKGLRLLMGFNKIYTNVLFMHSACARACESILVSLFDPHVILMVITSDPLSTAEGCGKLWSLIHHRFRPETTLPILYLFNLKWNPIKASLVLNSWKPAHPSREKKWKMSLLSFIWLWTGIRHGREIWRGILFLHEASWPRVTRLHN